MIAMADQGLERISDSSRDRQMHATARAALAESHYSALRKLECRVTEGVIEISGSVPSFYLKQLAQAAMLQIEGSGQVRNLVEVCGEPRVLVATSC